MIRIGELAKRTGISKRTLYHYEQIELLEPTLVTPNGYRYYDEQAVLHLQKILLLKSIGYTLEQIKTLFDHPSHPKENESWVASLTEQIELIEQKKEELNRKQYYLRSTLHTIQLKGTSGVEQLLQVIEGLNDRPLAGEVIPAQFDEELSLTSREIGILNRLPVLGSNDKRVEELIAMFQQVSELMPTSPHAPEAQAVAGRLYAKALSLFDGDEQLLDRYWRLLHETESEEPVVMGMDGDFMAYIDEMMQYYLAQREDEPHEQE